MTSGQTDAVVVRGAGGGLTLTYLVKSQVPVLVKTGEMIEAAMVGRDGVVGGAAAQAERPRWPDFDAELAVHAAVDTGLRGRLWRCRRPQTTSRAIDHQPDERHGRRSRG